MNGFRRQTKSNEFTPRLKLRRFVQVLLTPSVMGNRDEAERVSGVRKGLFYYWMRYSEEFRAWYEEQCDRFLVENESAAVASLIRRVQEGDTQAIRLFFQLRGKLRGEAFVDARSVQIQQTTASAPEDSNRVVVNAIEKLSETKRLILAKHIRAAQKEIDDLKKKG